MRAPIKLVDLELSVPLEPLEVPSRYECVQFLVRLHGRPVGTVTIPSTHGRVSVGAQISAVLTQLGESILALLVELGLHASVGKKAFRVEDLLRLAPAAVPGPHPVVTVAVCTRDRPDQLEVCLEALSALDYPEFDILVVDNAPRTDGVKHLIAARYPRVRHVVEPRPGLDWARNRAIIESRGEIIAFTDDDVIVDSGWLREITREFTESAEVMAVTGLVVPYQLETDAQVEFEQYGGFGRGFHPRWFQRGRDHWGRGFLMHGAGQFGTGANMAFRRSVFDRVGFFDPALDVGTPTNGGGDLEMYFRILKAGFALFYSPVAVVRHQHRSDRAGLRFQIEGWGTGFGAFAIRSQEKFPEERPGFRKLRRWWLRHYSRRLVRSVRRSEPWLRDLLAAEVRGALRARGYYRASQRRAEAVLKQYGPLAPDLVLAPDRLPLPPSSPTATGVRLIDVGKPLVPITDVGAFGSVRLFVALHGRVLGSVEVSNHGHSIGIVKLRHVIARSFYDSLIEPDLGPLIGGGPGLRWARTYGSLSRHFARADSVPPSASPTSVSIVIATCDRPDDLRACLASLRQQVSSHPIETVVVDNRPGSGLTPPVLADFPEVVLVREERAGLSYARNAGILASRGQIVLTTDDDVVAPPDWVERLVQAFDRPNVMIVTGNVLPLELATSAQRRFEQYGGLGRGFVPAEFGPRWFKWFRRHAVPTWQLGATANAAFRSEIFRHPAIGLLDERLGAGSPTGCSEDTYLFYRTLKAGFLVVYEPAAHVWHRHRSDNAGLRRQIRSYSTGHVAYHLITLLDDGDRRALWRLGWELPQWHLRRLLGYVGGRRDYPLWLILEEMRGNLTGPWALWQSHRRVRRLGRSNGPSSFPKATGS